MHRTYSPRNLSIDGSRQLINAIRLQFLDLEDLITKGKCYIKRKDCLFKYSTSEKFTGEYWLDGKKIYCQTLKGDGNNSYNTTVYIPFNPSNLNEIIKLEGLCYCGTDNRIVSLPYPDGQNSYVINYLYEVDNKRFSIYTQTRSLNRIYITVYYTKTTD